MQVETIVPVEKTNKQKTKKCEVLYGSQNISLNGTAKN